MAPVVRPLKILVLEDDGLILLDVQTSLSDAGHEVVPAMSVSEALLSLDVDTFDVATLDLRMDGEALQVAERLLQNNIPFVFCSGADRPNEPKFQHVPMISKPYLQSDLLAAVEGAAGSRE